MMPVTRSVDKQTPSTLQTPPSQRANLLNDGRARDLITSISGPPLTTSAVLQLPLSLGLEHFHMNCSSSQLHLQPGPPLTHSNLPLSMPSPFPPLTVSHPRPTQPLVQCYKSLKEQGVGFNLQLSETWLRHYQVLPQRTHPEMNMDGRSGYLLTGTTVSRT